MQEGEFYKVGGTMKKRVKTRILSATNRDLEKMIAQGSYRKDLYYRIGVVKINVPSLNERDEDIPLFVNYFLQIFNEKFNRSLTGIGEEALNLLKQYTWSGNVRELRNMIERAVLTAKGQKLTSSDLGLDEMQPGKIMEDYSTSLFTPLPSMASI